jgi:hypothetical protein
MSIPLYLNLAAGAPARLASLRAAFAKRNAHHTGTSWRDMRYSNFKSLHVLSQGRQGDGPVWYTHDGPAFPEKFADDVVTLLPRGWYTDEDHSETARGIVAKLPHGRWLAGYHWDSNGERVYFPHIHDSERDAAIAADGHAEWFAERAREDSERFNEAQRLAAELGEHLTRLSECLALRNKQELFPYARDEARECIVKIRARREELKPLAEYL